MAFWKNLSKRSWAYLSAVVVVVFLVCGLVLYPRYLRSQAEIPPTGIVLPDYPTSISVYVTGAVKKPGVYMLSHGSRIKDVLKLAEPLKNWDPEGINLAKRLDDEEMIVVPKLSNHPDMSLRDSYAHPSKRKLGADEKVSLNNASLSDLQALPGVGPGMAKKIFDYRLAHGSFGSVDDLKDVPGVGEKKFDRLKSHLRL